MTNEEVASLILKMKDGDIDAFEVLYENLWEMLYYSAKKQLNNSEDAKDAAQETMLEISQNIHKLKDEKAFIAWAQRILFCKCVYIHKVSTKYEYVAMDDAEEQIKEEKIEFLPDEILDNKETYAEISEMVSQLPKKQKEAILLYYFNGLNTNQIAGVMDSNPATIRQILTIARRTIKDKVEKIQRRGGVMYSVTTMPVLTRILMEDMKTVCTPEIKAQMFTTIQEAVEISKALAGVSVAGVATSSQLAQSTTTLGTASATTKLTITSTGFVFKISAAILTISFLGGGIALYVNSQKPLPNVQISTMAAPPVASSTPAATATAKPIEVLDDMIGKEDADIIRTWVEPSTDFQHDAFMEMTIKHNMSVDSAFVNIEENSDMYVMFTKEEQDKRLLLCEFYNATTGMWAVVYSVESIDTPIPQTYDISTWFAETQEKLKTT